MGCGGHGQSSSSPPVIFCITNAYSIRNREKERKRGIGKFTTGGAGLRPL